MWTPPRPAAADAAPHDEARRRRSRARRRRGSAGRGVVRAAVALLVLAAAPAVLRGQGGPPGGGGAPGGGPPGGITITVAPTQVSFSTPSISEFETGWVLYDAVSVDVDVQGNRPWTLYIGSPDPDLGGYGKPLGDLLWSVDGSGSWQPLGAAEAELTTGRGASEVVVRFRMLLDWAADVPDSYGADVDIRVDKG